VCYYTCEGPNHATLLSTVQLDVFLFRPFFLFVKLVDLYYSVSQVLLKPLGGVIFYFWTGNVFPNRSSDFCPKMAKGGIC
jgi:hypothetical protein